MKMDLKILLIDDDVPNSIFLKQFLEAEGFSVTYASDGIVGWELFLSDKPQLVLLDIIMPGINGFDLAKKIRSQNKEVLIFFLSDRTSKEDRLLGFKLEGNDYITKPFYPEEVVAKIHERIRQIGIKEQAVFHFANTVYNVNLSSVDVGGEATTLTGRQNDILHILVQNIGVMVSREYILEKVWGVDSFANSLSLNVQMNYLRKALSRDSDVSIETLRKRGYILKIENSK